MATQSLEFGYTAGQTLTAKLFAIGSDTVVQTASSVTEKTNAEGRYLAVFTDAPAANYLLVYYLGGTGAGSEKYVLTLDTATFQPQSEKLTGEIATAGTNHMDANSTKLAAIALDADRIPASPATESTAAAAQTAAEASQTAAEKVALAYDADGTLTAAANAEIAASLNGVGAHTISLTVKLSAGTIVSECDCVLTTTNTNANTNVYASGRTNANGVVTFDVDEGTYYLWRQKAGVNFTNPKTVTVDSAGTATVS